MELTIRMKLDNDAMQDEDGPDGLAVADALRAFAVVVELVTLVPPVVIPIRDGNGNLIGAATISE